jgi:hypothetical protein
VTPVVGPASGGNSVTITGSGFIGVTGVNFGSVAANFTFVSDTEIVATTPPGGSGSQVDITVTNPVGTSATGAFDRFTYLTPPVVSEVKPNSGPSAGKFEVVVVGSGFTMATAVSFGPTPTTSFSVQSDAVIAVIAPPGQGVVGVTVTTPTGTSSIGQAGMFTYIPAPVVTGVNPDFLNPGQSTTISGSGFAGANAVNFGTAPATGFNVVSDSQIVAVIPQGTGSVNVTVRTIGGTSAITAADVFIYVSPQ